jgi:hypothetical protein
MVHVYHLVAMTIDKRPQKTAKYGLPVVQCSGLSAVVTVWQLKNCLGCALFLGGLLCYVLECTIMVRTLTVYGHVYLPCGSVVGVNRRPPAKSGGV